MSNHRTPIGLTYLEAIKAGYKVVNRQSMIIYKPNIVSRRRRIISA